MRELDIALSIGMHLERLQSRGYDVLQVDEFERVAELVSQTGRQSQTPMLSVTRQDFTRSEAFWLFLTFKGNVVGGMGSKLTDLADETFETYTRRTSQNQYSRCVDPIASMASVLSQRLSGKLIYLGELELRNESRGNPAVLSSFSRIMQGLCAVKWRDFDWMYAFIPDEHFHLARYYGLTWSVPNAITWVSPPPEGRLDSHWIMAISRADYEHLVLAEKRGLVGHKRK
ncbi:MAG: hypothetical protein QNJ44_09845 [Rhodobacter sp.]|nr:hypothetical protein [Rhodobacter sp.]